MTCLWTRNDIFVPAECFCALYFKAVGVSRCVTVDGKEIGLVPGTLLGVIKKTT
jgi:hypothetical protein